MPTTRERIGRRQSIPVLHTRGTHYEVGFDVGRTFSGMIHSFLAQAVSLNEAFLPLYETEAGQRLYEDALAAVQAGFPQYMDELRGTADGAKVSFYKLFLLHMDNLIPLNKAGMSACEATCGCSTICVNQPGHEYMGHTEDAQAETLNHVYLVSAHVVPGQGEALSKEERFTALCYAGHLPGLCMGYNHHGLVFSCNIVRAAATAGARAGSRTPRHFLTRALLGADSLEAAQRVLRDESRGTAEGFSVNMTFLHLLGRVGEEEEEVMGRRVFYNVEVGPPATAADRSSLVSVLACPPGQHFFHCNKFLRLQIPEAACDGLASSVARHATKEARPDPSTERDVVDLLGDQTHPEYTVFREAGDDDLVKTVAVGIFDFTKRTWSLYADNPKTHDPVVVLPLLVKEPAQ